MAKNILYGNVMPTPLSPFSTGDKEADEAIGKLQVWPFSPHTPFPRPDGHKYHAAVRAAERVGARRLVPLLDEAAVATGRSRWSDEHSSSLDSKDRKVFQAHYDAVKVAIAVRKAYLHWLIGAVCTTRAGLERVLEVATSATTTARLIAADTLRAHLDKGPAKRRFAEVVDVATWDGKKADLVPAYRSAVSIFSGLDPRAAFDRWNVLLRPEALRTRAGKNRAEAVMRGIVAGGAPDPRWTAAVLPALKTSLDYEAIGTLLALPPDPIAHDAVCKYLPNPNAKRGYWYGDAVAVLSRIAEKRSLPWLVAALKSSWMNWASAFEGFRRAKDPEMAHVIRDWLKDNDAPDRRKVGRSVIAELEKAGNASKPKTSVLARESKAARMRPVLKFQRPSRFDKPKLESRAKTEKYYRKAFAAAGMGDYFNRIAQPAVQMIPKRVNETRLEVGVSKLGGHPDLAAKTAWPRVKREPLTFLGQIALADVAALLPRRTVPASGLLSFFMGLGDIDESAAGYCEHGRVIFTPARTKLVRREVPDDYFETIYQAATVRLHPSLSLPWPTNRHLTKLLKGAKRDRYEADVFVPPNVLPQLLGYRTHGYDAEEPETSQLLLQLPGDNQTDMVFGDHDVLGLYLRQRKLAARDFSKVWPHLGD